MTFTATASPASGLYQFRYSLVGTAANTTDLGQVQHTGADSSNPVGVPHMESVNLVPASGYTQNVVVPVNTDSTTESDELLTFRIDSFINAITSDPHTLPSPAWKCPKPA